MYHDGAGRVLSAYPEASGFSAVSAAAEEERLNNLEGSLEMIEAQLLEKARCTIVSALRASKTVPTE